MELMLPGADTEQKRHPKWNSGRTLYLNSQR